ncbi:MAG: hypothetical protein II429_04345 [Prevotella sp.]|jgi:hypothetical protein|nr:hypothetical protein [Prevotella sp.]MBQ2193532.1 hypothetical protein [Prevotella sp.]
MKFLRILIPLFCLLTACGGDDANETNTPGQTTTQPSCSWVQRSWEASSAAGEITIEVRSKGTMWTAEHRFTENIILTSQTKHLF